MAVLGLDGVIAEFCGNGARVCAAFLYTKYLQKRVFLSTPSGIHALEKHGDLYSVKLPLASFALNKKFVADAQQFKKLGYTYVNMLEPHLILEKELSDEELFSLGQELNQRKDLFPHGINVNVCRVLKEGHLFVKTYERGVQRLTQSCGTGSMSCAAFYKSQGVVSVSTPGGQLQILLQEDGIVLIGPAFFSYSNKIEKAD